MIRDICLCGIARVDCDYHKPEPAINQVGDKWSMDIITGLRMDPSDVGQTFTFHYGVTKSPVKFKYLGYSQWEKVDA